MDGMMGQFEIGKWYSSRDIHNEVGGELQTYLPEKDGQIVAGRFGLQMNPNAPGEVFVGNLPRVRDKAVMLSRQATPIPVFIKDKKSDRGFKYVGRYRAVHLLNDDSSIASAERRSDREDLAFVLRLERVGD